MNRLFCVLVMVFALASCGPDKKSMGDEQISTVAEFVDAFPGMKLPLMIHDSTMEAKPKDSFRLSEKVVKKFIPDTVFKPLFKGLKPKYYGIGKATDNNGDHYLFIRVQASGKKMPYVLCFDKESQFKTGMPLLGTSTKKEVSFEGGLDRKFIIYKNSYRHAKDGQYYYTRNAFVYNTAGTFTLILKESNDIPEEEEIYNPIDTLSAKMKFTGDYVLDKKNFVSVRDGSKPGRLLFFVHFEKPGDCIGELKGELSMVDAKKGIYAEAGDPCSLELEFSGNNVRLKEAKGCGNYRGIKCFFDGQYPKRASKKRR